MQYSLHRFGKKATLTVFWDQKDKNGNVCYFFNSGIKSFASEKILREHILESNAELINQSFTIWF